VTLTHEDLDPGTAPQFSDLTPGSYLKLTVRDTCHGMDDGVMKRIFEPYFTTKGVGEAGNGFAVVAGAKEVTSEQITPMDDEDFKDF